MRAPFFVHDMAELGCYPAPKIRHVNPVVQMEGRLDNCALVLRGWKAETRMVPGVCRDTSPRGAALRWIVLWKLKSHARCS